jgi:acetyl-CoA carboxylase biotin carboxyl carrier protein
MIDNEKLEGIKKLVNLAKDLGLGSLSYEDPDMTVAFDFPCQHDHSTHTQSYAQPTANAPVCEEKPMQSAKPTKDEGFIVESPLLGRFYGSPAPNADAFVQIGSIVQAGDTICIIESMKVMNEIITDKPGRVLEILATNGQEVVPNQPLFLMEPL